MTNASAARVMHGGAAWLDATTPTAPVDTADDALRPHPEQVPALSLSGVWKLFGTPRRVRAAARLLGQQPDREALKQSHDVFAAVAGVDLQVQRREILAIVGMSGSGKSTLVRHMNGLIRPTVGTVCVDGRSIGSLSPRELQVLRSSQVGMVFQSTSLFPHRNVIDNVVFGLEVRRVPHHTRYKIAREWLDRVQLADWAHHFPGELSGGMQQRVGLARTFVTDPETLLLDEPFSALDPIIRRSLQDQFVALVRGLKKTAVFITHDFGEAIRVADRIGVMANGRIIQVGTPHDIVANPASPYVAGFSTPEIRRKLVCASDLARPRPALSRPHAASKSLAGDTTLSDIASHLQAEDTCFQVVDKAGRSLGWIDRGLFLEYISKTLDGSNS